MWDPGQYRHFSRERARPFADLLARIGADRPRSVVDLGCGPGDLTVELARRWPETTVLGIDNSPDMIEAARKWDGPPGLSFALADIRDWRPAGPVDVVTANAVLQWVPGHPACCRAGCPGCPAVAG